VKILTCPQYSDEWFEEILGSIGGSSIATVTAKKGTSGRTTLLFRKAGEIISREPYQGYTNELMHRGHEFEPWARDYYEELTGNTVEEVGLIRRAPYKHYSPDGLVGFEGMIEIKTAIPSIHIQRIVKQAIESNYRKQIQWGLSCAREWCDFISYCPEISDFPLWVQRVYPDKKLIKELDTGADIFIEEMLDIVEKVKTYEEDSD
jgi:hypothetical protein